MDKNREAYVNEVIDVMEDSYDRLYIYSDTSLDESTVKEIVRAGSFDSLWEEDWVWEASALECWRILDELKEEVPTFGDLEFEDIEDYIRDQVYDRMNNDWLDRLLGQTSSVFTHFHGKYEEDECEFYNYDTVEENVDLLIDKLTEAGFVPHGSFEDMRGELEDLVLNAGEHSPALPLFVFESSLEQFPGAGWSKYDITVTDPTVWLGNTFEGCGHAVQLGGTISFPLSELCTDSMYRYGYEEVYGCAPDQYDVVISKRSE